MPLRSHAKQALFVMLILNNGQVDFGDCIDVIFYGGNRPGPLFKAAGHQKIAGREIADFLGIKGL